MDCKEHALVLLRLDNIQKEQAEQKKDLKELTAEVMNLSTHEKIYIAILGLCSVGLSTIGSIVGAIIAKVL